MDPRRRRRSSIDCEPRTRSPPLSVAGTASRSAVRIFVGSPVVERVPAIRRSWNDDARNAARLADWRSSGVRHEAEEVVALTRSGDGTGGNSGDAGGLAVRVAGNGVLVLDDGER